LPTWRSWGKVKWEYGLQARVER
jgi:hypothetical protein